MNFLGVKILLSCVFLIYVNVEAAPSPQVRQVQKLFIIFWSSMVKRRIAKTKRLGFDSPLKVRFFFPRPSLVRIRIRIGYIFFYWRSSFHLISSPFFNHWCPSFPSVRGRSLLISGRLPFVLNILSQTVFPICHNQVLQFCICFTNKWLV